MEKTLRSSEVSTSRELLGGLEGRFSMDKYIPIDCNFHDGLLAKISLRKRVLIKYQVGEELQTKETHLKDVYTKEKEEFLVMEDGETIRLDQIISVDGLQLLKEI